MFTIFDAAHSRCMKIMKNKIAEIINLESEEAVFPELALTLFTFIRKLNEELVNSGASDVFFLSREGQVLKKLFDEYQAANRNSSTVQIKTHYLEVSRRATMLPSLGSLETETFETLFRQYRAISLVEFLSSIGLHDFLDPISAALNIDKGLAEQRLPDFPSHQYFSDLVKNAEFRKIYESQRLARRRAFIEYVKTLSGGKIPAEMMLVDVGWKGTIQDNIFNIFNNSETKEKKTIVGYYVGLVAEGAAAATNKKYGLLFSCCGERSKNFNVFNENRALFEVILAADHGSIVSYENDLPVRGSFDEELMISKWIFPTLNKIVANFNKLVSTKELRELPLPLLSKISADFHSRMVFKPTSSELDWFKSIFHVENFGIFENSVFSHGSKKQSRFEKAKFCMEFLRKKGRVELGFWPYKTILEKGGTMIAVAYKHARCARGR